MKKLICFYAVCCAVHYTNAQIDLTNTGVLSIGSGTDTFSISGNFSNTSSASFTNNGKVYAKENYTNNQASTPVGTGELILNGTGAQSISTTSTSPFYRLTINKASGLAALASAVTVNNTLTLSAGKLSLDNYHLTLANSATISGAGTNTYLIATGAGELKQQIAAMGSKTFPVGTSAAYTPITISLALLSTTDEFNVRMLPAVYSNGTTGSQMNSNSVNATWMVSEAVNGGSNATLTCQWPASLELTGFNRMFSRLAHYTSSAWNYGLLNIIASGSNPYTVSRSGFTSFSPFAVTMFMAVLPSASLELTGKNIGNDNQLQWTTAAETNSSYFAIETSLNGTDFTEAGRTGAAGNSNSKRTYSFVHKNIQQQSYYYRIRQVDIDGTIIYSTIICINMAALKTATLYPNPVRDKTSVRFSLQQSSAISAVVINASGLQVYRFNQFYTKGEHTINLNLAVLPAGSYLLQLKDESGTGQTFQFVKNN